MCARARVCVSMDVCVSVCACVCVRVYVHVLNGVVQQALGTQVVKLNESLEFFVNNNPIQK